MKKRKSDRRLKARIEAYEKHMSRLNPNQRRAYTKPGSRKR